jgi:uncharacterized protein YlaI
MSATTYECPACHQRITVYVPLVENPTCTRHTGGGRQMKPVTDNKENNK